MSVEYRDQGPLLDRGVRYFNPETGAMKDLSDYGNLSNAVVIPYGASTVHIGGQVGANKDGSIPKDIAEEHQLAFEHVERALITAGVKEGWKAVYKLHYLWGGDTSDEQLQAYGAAVVKFCGTNRPTQVGFNVKSIMWPGARVELCVEAVLPK